jgi:AcrR family transcriptional regulator
MGRPSVRQQLVDAALGVFQSHGFNGSSVQDLTDAAGVPKGSFYNHFKSKEDLALEALQLYMERPGGARCCATSSSRRCSGCSSTSGPTGRRCRRATTRPAVSWAR